MEKHIMLAFVSPVNARSLGEPIIYPDIQGKPYTAIQTNESAIVYVERMLGEKNSLAKIFLIASDSVRKGKVQYGNEFGDITHLEFLQKRIEKECPQLADKFSVQNYSDNSAELEKNILQTAEIADAVIRFAKENPDDKIIVHADMTGGFRHASMLMLSIIQLLKYRGVEIGEVLYSDPTSKPKVVYSVQEIQRMFSLITGADEFVKFGSVEALNEYFDSNKPDAVEDLLDAMNRFSEAIKICRTSKIEDELKNLSRHIKTFREQHSKDLRSELFAKIIDTIEREYGSLIGGATERLTIIRWCVRKGFLQQALTLCVEWLPEEIVKREICTPKDSGIKEICELRANSDQRTWQQHFIVEYKVAKQDDSERNFCEELRDVLRNHSGDGKCPEEERFKKLKYFLEEYANSCVLFSLYVWNKKSIDELEKIYPIFVSVLKAISEHRNIALNRIFHDRIPRLVAGFPNTKLLELFEVEDEQVSESEEDKKLNNRLKEYRQMFSEKVICSELDEEKALSFLEGYYKLRQERNNANHASTKASTPVSDIKDIIDKYLSELEKIPVS